MQTQVLSLIFTLLLSLALASHSTAQTAGHDPAQNQDGIWHSDWSKARALAKAEQKPLLVAFR